MKDFEEVKREETADFHPFSFFSSPSVQDRVIDAFYHDTVKKGERVVDVRSKSSQYSFKSAYRFWNER